MYGLINSAFRDFVRLEFGDEVWHQIAADTEIGEESFRSMRQQPDETSYALVASASIQTKFSQGDLLKRYGEYWISHVAANKYRTLMQDYGDSLIEFLSNINRLHKEISSTFLDYSPPQFDIKQTSGNTYELEYFSHRAGLSPFVHGLLDGLAKHYQTALKIEQIRGESGDSPLRAVFRLAL